MAESLDGGAVTYRSNRHFDVLNENLIYAFHGATKASDFQSAAPNATGSQPFGYERFELNFGKQIPQFKTYNSMMPLWRQLDRNTGHAIHLLALYSAVSEARSASPALRSKEGWFLRPNRNPPQDQIFGVGKVEKVGADPASSDTVLAFVNLAVGANTATPNGVGFDVDIKAGQQNVFGISPNHTYNVKNIAALDPNRRGRCLWGAGRVGRRCSAERHKYQHEPRASR